jgi:hypothetical protein
MVANAEGDAQVLRPDEIYEVSNHGHYLPGLPVRLDESQDKELGDLVCHRNGNWEHKGRETPAIEHGTGWAEMAVLVKAACHTGRASCDTLGG